MVLANSKGILTSVERRRFFRQLRRPHLSSSGCARPEEGFSFEPLRAPARRMFEDSPRATTRQ
jgi:hypothetical protein